MERKLYVEKVTCSRLWKKLHPIRGKVNPNGEKIAVGYKENCAQSETKLRLVKKKFAAIAPGRPKRKWRPVGDKIEPVQREKCH